jgi:hypothetical protein
LQACFADTSRNIGKPGLGKCGNTSDKAWQLEENKGNTKKTFSRNSEKEHEKKQEKTGNKYKQENGTGKKQEKSTKQFQSKILASC